MLTLQWVGDWVGVEVSDFYRALMEKQGHHLRLTDTTGGGRMVRWCWVNFQCRGVLQFGLQ